jgi:hypothetical protein
MLSGFKSEYLSGLRRNPHFGTSAKMPMAS